MCRLKIFRKKIFDTTNYILKNLFQIYVNCKFNIKYCVLGVLSREAIFGK